jgi:acetate kinase
MNVLVFNCGSSSLKYKLIKMPESIEFAGGEAQRVGPPTVQPACIINRTNGKEKTFQVNMPDHAVAFEEVMKILKQTPQLQPNVVGHRLVHGGSIFKNHVAVNEKIFEELQTTKKLAPLHNPPAITLVDACRKLYPDLPQVLVFDTAYHSTIPEYARTYALPECIRNDLGIRKYGFHGTSHQYVAGEAAKFMGIPIEKLNAVSCHLGSGGASLCAIVNGKSIDNTMGHSPLQGLIMSTRCGDLGAAVVMQLVAENFGDWQSVEKLLNKQSGVLGISGRTGDIRDVVEAVSRQGDESKMNETLRAYIWRIKKYLASYLTVVASAAGKQADAIIFTDTIGETVPLVRWGICSDMQSFGVVMDADTNDKASKLPVDLATNESRIRILVIQTNEELAIAQYTYAIITKSENKTNAKGGAA